MNSSSEDGIRLKRIYRRPRRSDGVRILVDRLWPRGLSKEAAYIDHWMKDVAPSDELRKWFAHDVTRWEAFRDSYRKELDANETEVPELQRLCRQGTITLLFAARDEAHNQAVVIRQWLVEHEADGKA